MKVVSRNSNSVCFQVSVENDQVVDFCVTSDSINGGFNNAEYFDGLLGILRNKYLIDLIVHCMHGRTYDLKYANSHTLQPGEKGRKSERGELLKDLFSGNFTHALSFAYFGVIRTPISV
ncbi:MAG: hypothetical protein E6Q75_07025 [Rheinheimera sp.]|nr:MAG: hypothetical protein E6Q75_07025 [Rheinheimera sp.]